ncbi:sensor domain-containing protein [Actinomadura barringtoniae]|uniref:histidine kinase n=1 Tax=Actinomadura barringtoniae TaxID=1427535 RepID=A0A939PNI4_9ACTN|nr:sensor histidine kinase [Actinomadura barringtoniae]MBO2451831.1 sensor domain-containing protein [Actinomadura barringtoniae]
MRSRTAWQALTTRRLLVSSWPWRSVLYLAGGVASGAVELLLLVVTLTVGIASSVLLVGIPLLIGLGLSGLPIAALERRRLRIVDRDPAESPHRDPDRPGVRPWLTTRYREQTTWRELAFTLLKVTLLWPLELTVLVAGLSIPGGLLTTPLLLAASGPDHETRVLKTWMVTHDWQAWAMVPIGLVALAVSLYLMTLVAAARASLARALLAARPGSAPELHERVNELTRSRVRLVDAFDAERRRIERDLHDGAQQRLVALTMTLGLARASSKSSNDSETAALVTKAHEEAKLALGELRELIQGIHPKVLTDRGLAAAVDELADRFPVPVETRIELPGRLPDPVEAAIYFAICEALTNVAKHSDADCAWVTAEHREGRVAVIVRDDGVGGARPGIGTGLSGLADRVSVLDGTVTLSSPPGGPTLLRLEIPCAQAVPSA